MPRPSQRQLRVATVAALIAIGVVLRLVIVEPGPFLLIPIVLAGLWGGRSAGAGVGAACAALFGAATALHPGEMAPSALGAFGVRLPLFAFVGFLVGRLAEERGVLTDELAEKSAEVTELRAIQRALAPPEPPERPGLDIAAHYLPAADGASGDFYLVAKGPTDGTTILVIGDVVGKGVEAAQRAAFVRTALATSAPFVDDPCRLLQLANQSLIEKAGTSSLFVTAACAVYTREEECLRWALAGHWPPLLLDHVAELRHEKATPPLGIKTSLECRVGQVMFGSGAGVLLFTDGVPEARRRNGSLETYGRHRLHAAVKSHGDGHPSALVHRLATEVSDFSDEELTDDVCVVAVRAH